MSGEPKEDTYLLHKLPNPHDYGTCQGLGMFTSSLVPPTSNIRVKVTHPEEDFVCCPHHGIQPNPRKNFTNK